MESIEKLREKSLNYAPNIRRDVNMALNEIEREIAEKYMLLPVDADGTPWDFTEKGFIDPQGNDKGLREIIFNTATERWELLGSDSYVSVASECRHVKPRTLTDVLADLFDRKMSVTDAEHEISELLGGDA